MKRVSHRVLCGFAPVLMLACSSGAADLGGASAAGNFAASGAGGAQSLAAAGSAGAANGGTTGTDRGSVVGQPLAAGASAAGSTPGTAGAAAGAAAMSAGAGAAGAMAGPSAGSAAGASGAAGSPDTAPTNANCGKRSGMRGKTSRTIMVGSDKRNFIAYLPQSADPLQALPFVYVFHGANQTGQILYDMTTYSALADREGIAVVFPDGQGVSSMSGAASLTPWNVSDGGALCGLGTLVSNPNPIDFAFMDAMKAEIEQDQCLDNEHVYSTGFSMGGYMTHHIACERTDIRAAAPHSGGTLADLSGCKTQHVPIIIFHGTADPLIAANCDDPMLAPDPGFMASATLWAKKNGCKPTFTTVPTNGTNGSNGSCYVYDDCPPDGQVEMCSFDGLAHAWAGAPVCQSCIGQGPNYASATQLQWDFFKKYAW